MTSLPMGPGSPWLAPLAGYSDLPFRLLCREYGAAVCCTEMVSAKGLVYGSQGTEHIIATHESDAPLVLQLYGAEEEFVAQAMDILLERGFTWFDLNAGCSVPKVVKTGAGAALLTDIPRLAKLLRIMTQKAGQGRVGVKFRRGWAAGEDVYLELAEQAQAAGVGWLTLHPRYARQLFKGEADWSVVAVLAREASAPVLASGDLFTARDGVRCLEQSGAAGVMFARGALKNPAIFHGFASAHESRSTEQQGDAHNLGRMIRRHMELAQAHGNPYTSVLKMRTFVPRYVRHLPRAKALRKALCSCTSWERLEAILDEYVPLAGGSELAARKDVDNTVEL